MPRKTGLIIKKEIVQYLNGKPLALRELETKIRTNYLMIRKHCEELEYFGLIKLVKHKRNSQNHRPYITAELTEYGRKF